MAIRDIVQAAAGAGGGNEYVEDVFSTYLYTGTGSAITITNGIDLAGEGGMVWNKCRTSATNHAMSDTERGIPSTLKPNTTAGKSTSTGYFTSFNSDGWSMGGNTETNLANEQFASWTFRKAPHFFDIVTWTGDGTTGRLISHNLESRPGFIVIKRTDSTGDWFTCARVDDNTARVSDATPFALNSNADSDLGSWATIANSTTINLNMGGLAARSTTTSNINGATYVAYLWAHNAGGFGDDGEQNVISCGSYTETVDVNDEVNLGFEPQWLMIKNATGAGDWYIFDTMRGFNHSIDRGLRANTTVAENTTFNYAFPTATGFNPPSSFFGAGTQVIYIAIRRPMKTPESGTEVFHPTFSINPGSPAFVSPFPVDFVIHKDSTGGQPRWSQRLAPTRLQSSSTAGETTTVEESFSFQNGQYAPIDYGSPPGAIGSTSHMAWMFARRPGFMDVVAFTQVGTGSVQTINHNLTVVPELIIFKTRGGGDNWRVRVGSYSGGGILNSNSGFSSSLYATNLTSTTFGFNQGTAGYSSGMTFVSYLFATLAGVSKVGSYTGTGADLNVDCGFSAGARFILIKRTDSTGDWYVWDSARGIVAGNDPYLLLNSAVAQVTNTDYIDPLASGFTVTSSAPAALNASGGTYIFLAIA